ncbi:MAG: type III pantothenate kinase [Deltaproteobacteria bacterium]|nr:type III pantothenate kinase [Deltaproteobacteria bacterium]MBW2340136.1 type III pantothenate kinase [Deltaproteobacteria bacterium]
MLLCIDVGNTNIVLGIFQDDTMLDHWRIRTERDMTGDELGLLVNNLFIPAKLEMSSVDAVIISCVVPPLLSAFREFCLRYFGQEPMIVGPDINTGMPIEYDHPKEVGADRIVNAVAAYQKYRTGLIIVDFGTATTFDYISSEGVYEGGAIAPGIIISAEALFQKASKLPRVEIFANPKTVIAKETISSMNAGLIYGYAGLVDGIVNRIKKEAGSDTTVVATGGLAPLIKSEATTIDYVEEFLALEGLKTIFDLNAPAQALVPIAPA